MTIATFADLKSQAAALLNRSNLTTQIPYFVQLAETRIAFGSKEQPFVSEPLRIRAMETSSDLTVNAQTVALPTGYLEQRRLYLAGTPTIKLNYITPDIFWSKWISSTTGQPSDFTIEGENIVFGPTPDTSYTGKLLYRKQFTALSADADTNWLLANAPNVYLFGTLLEGFAYARNMEQATSYANKFAGAVNALNDADKADRFATPWASRPDIDTP